MESAGAVVTILGVVSAGLSIIGYVEAANVCDGACHDVQGLGAIPWTIAGVAGTAGGLIAMSIGIPLWVAGADDDEPEDADPTRMSTAVAAARLLAGPASARLVVSF